MFCKSELSVSYFLFASVSGFFLAFFSKDLFIIFKTMAFIILAATIIRAIWMIQDSILSKFSNMPFHAFVIESQALAGYVSQG